MAGHRFSRRRVVSQRAAIARVVTGLVVAAIVLATPSVQAMAATDAEERPSESAATAQAQAQALEIVPGAVLELKRPTGLEVPAVSDDAASLLAEQVQGLLAEPEPLAQPVTTSFTVSSFNVLGAGHSKKRGVSSGPVRARMAATLLRNHNVSVAGLQEFQLPQVRAFAGVAPNFGIYPGGSLGASASHNSIVWNTGVWSLVQAATTKIPYFRGNRLAMPHVLLEHRASGQQVWFMNYHNPANARGPAQRWRNLATSIEGRLANRLLSTGAPVIMTGDFNDRRVFACQITRIAPLHSADGARTEGGRCLTPRRMNVDWILGSPAVSFSGFVTDRSALVNRTSDHPMIRSQVTITP